MTEQDSGQYVLGDSSAELDRIKAIHESTVDYLGKLVLAPVDFTSSSLRILDSGTAGGHWLQSLKKENGEAHDYIGTDITVAFFPKPESADGITYRAQDVTAPWPRNWLSSFDLVHQRFVFGGVPKQRLQGAVKGLIDLVKPGGWIQIMESDVREDDDDTAVDGSLADGAAPIWSLLRHLYLSMDVEPDLDRCLPTWLAEAGLVDIHEQRSTVPVGARRGGTDMARVSADAMVATAEQLATAIRGLGNSPLSNDELDGLALQVRTALEKEGGTYRVYAIWARRPWESDDARPINAETVPHPTEACAAATV
ncbi:hypothetical protein GQ53DRAFT_826418 [Thozetella sp. PMI_491]|nr:hypothetical protein GQ53DRAFT_826418 [Thozetella sp. PMI_491]